MHTHTQLFIINLHTSKSTRPLTKVFTEKNSVQIDRGKRKVKKIEKEVNMIVSTSVNVQTHNYM